MHQTAVLGTTLQDSRKFGWEFSETGEGSERRPRRSRRGDTTPVCRGKSRGMPGQWCLASAASTLLTAVLSAFSDAQLGHNEDCSEQLHRLPKLGLQGGAEGQERQLCQRLRRVH